jgi:bleomycin hydrolase
MKMIIEFDTLDRFQEDFISSDKHRVVMNSVVKNGINDSCNTTVTNLENTHNFSISLESGKIKNQKVSGRCWMFASLNVMRLKVMEKLNLEDMELSQVYPLFWDKLEKANYFLENILETLDEEVEGRVISFLLHDPLCDGGQWDMFVNLVGKYGVVPKEAMPESFSSSNTKEMNFLLTAKLRNFACDIRAAFDEGKSLDELRKLKERMLNEIYRMLCISLGEPPKTFTYEVRDKNDQFIRVENITPLNFYDKYVGMDLSEYVSIINAPTDDKPFDRTFTVQYLGNIKGSSPVLYLNLRSNELKRMAIKQMQDGEAVWFGSDVSHFTNRISGIMALNTFDFDGLFTTEFPMDKGQRLDFGQSCMNHAMVLTGVNLDEEGKPNRWRVENSWGEEKGNKGFFVMSDNWFDQFTYQVVVHKKYLSDQQLAILKTDPIVLKPWDPMGSLA